MNNAQLFQELAKKHQILVEPESKRKGYFVGSFLIPAFACLFPILSGAYRSGRVMPIIIVFILGFLWYQIYYWGHHATAFERFKQMPRRQQQEHLLLDSFWHNMMRSGIGTYMIFSVGWGILEIGADKDYYILTNTLMLSFIVFATVCIMKLRWIVSVAVSGLKKHKHLRFLVATVLGLIGGLPLLPGVTNMVRVTQGQDGLIVMVPFVMTALLLMTMVMFIMTLIGFITAFTQYNQWYSMKS